MCIEIKMTLKSIPLEKKHIALGARMGPFGGWNMPVQYPDGIINEHEHTRQSVSIFDCSHMGQFRLRGENAADDLDRLFPRLVSTQKLKSCRYNFLLTEEGTVCDDLIVYRIAWNEFYIVVNGATIESDAENIKSHLSGNTEFINESERTVKLDIQGPAAGGILTKFNLFDDEQLKYYQFIQKKINGIPCLVSRTGYTGELGYEIYFDIDYCEELWDLFIECAPIKPAGLGARDTLRLEMGYPLYGHELTKTITPIEAGFSKMLKMDHEFIAKKKLMTPPRKKLVGIRFHGRRAVREGALIFDASDQQIGEITSGSFSPSLKYAIALGYIDAEMECQNLKVFGKIASTTIPGVIDSLPFYTNGTARMSMKETLHK